MVWYMSVWFWGVLIALPFVAWGVVRKFVKGLPFINRPMGFALVALIGLAWASGALTGLGTGSIGGEESGSYVTELQVTTAAAGNCTEAEDTTQDDLYNIRCTDAQSAESAATVELQNLRLTVFRSGATTPWSCPVTCSTPTYASEISPGDGTRYRILQETALGELYCYVEDGANATTSSPKAKTFLSFSDGEASTTLGIRMEVEESAQDALAQYSYRDVTVDVCGKPYTIRFQDMD